jgi:hypothetical protein
VSYPAALIVVLGLLSAACGPARVPSAGPQSSHPGSESIQPIPPPRLATPTALAGSPAARPLEALDAAGLAPVELTAVAVEGFPPLPSYRAKVRNLSDRPVRRVLATVVYLDAADRPMPGEEHDVSFGSPLKAIDPGVTLEAGFLSRVERAPGVRLVVRSITFLEKGSGAEPGTREWANPRYDADLAALRGASPGEPR